MLNGGARLVDGSIEAPKALVLCSLFVLRSQAPPTRAKFGGTASVLFGRLRAPALVVGLAGLLPIRRRPDHHVDLGLLVALDRGLPGAAVLLAPDQRQLGARLRVLLVDEAEREHLALVE